MTKYARWQFRLSLHCLVMAALGVTACIACGNWTAAIWAFSTGTWAATTAYREWALA